MQSGQSFKTRKSESVMIVGSLENISTQVHQHPNIRAALAYLQDLNPTQIEDGRYPINDPAIFAIFQSYMTENPPEIVEVEGHRKFIDIYLMLEGSEQVGWIPTDRLGDLPEYDSAGDVWKMNVDKAQLSFVALEEGDAGILFPEDAHAAQFAVRSPGHARKVVMKVAV